jgi:hypothetical protein
MKYKVSELKIENQYDALFITAKKKYQQIIETIYQKTITQANDKKFAHNYFIQQTESEIEYYQSFSFNALVVSYFQIFYKMGFSWKKFLNEVRILQMIHTFRNKESNIKEFAILALDFTPQEIRRIEIESKMMEGIENDEIIYNHTNCNLISKNRDIDFIKYVAKHQAMREFIIKLRNNMENHNETKKNIIRISNETIRWNGAKGKKIELIRLLVALNDCKYFETSDGTIPSQDQLMTYFGEVLSVNLNHFEQDLSNGLESKLQTNTAIFDKLKLAIEKRFHQKVEQN